MPNTSAFARITVMLALWLLASFVVSAQFGIGLQQSWATYHDANGLFSISLPPGWLHQPNVSHDDLHVFYGPGSYDILYLEVLTVNEPTSSANEAQKALTKYATPGGLPRFAVISPPSTGTLAGQNASFIVYSYSDEDDTTIVEGRAFAVYSDKVITVVFGDAAERFDANVTLFNTVMESLQLHVAPAGSAVAFGIGTRSPDQPTLPVANPAVYTSPGVLYQFTPPTGWALWEEQSTSRGDTIEPWNGVFNWQSRPMTKTLFIWDYFDAWQQTGTQYEIVLGVIENVPGSLDDAIETLKNGIMGNDAHIYTTTATRTKIGSQNGMIVQIVTRPGMVEPWSSGSTWHKTVTFYVFKQGTNVFVWAIPNDVLDVHDVVQAVQSFQWLAG